MNMPLIGADPTHDVCNPREHGLLGNGQANDQPALAALVEKLGPRPHAEDSHGGGAPGLPYR